MKKLLSQTCRIVSERQEKCLSSREYANLQKRYRNILTRGSREVPEIPPKPKGKRGKIAKADAHNLLEQLKKHETAVLLFAKERHVPFTNNKVERAPYGQSETESTGVFPKTTICSCILSNPQLSANYGCSGSQPACCHSDCLAQQNRTLIVMGVSSYFIFCNRLIHNLLPLCKW